MVKVNVQIEGLREIDAALGQIGKTASRNVLRRVGLARMQPIAEDMRGAAPDDPSTSGNDLKASITVTTKKPKRHKKESFVEVYAGPDPRPSAHMQEFGTQNHGPQPFARPAWDRGKDRLLDGIKDDLWSEIDKAAQRQARKTARIAAKMGK